MGNPINPPIHLCAMPPADEGRAVCRLPLAQWHAAGLSHIGGSVAISLLGRLVLAVAQLLDPHPPSSDAATHMTLDAETIFLPNAGAAAGALSLASVHVLPAEAVPKAACVLVVVVSDDFAGLASPQSVWPLLKRTLRGRVVCTGCFVRLNANTRVRVVQVHATPVPPLPPLTESVPEILSGLAVVTWQTQWDVSFAADSPIAPSTSNVSAPLSTLPGLDHEFASLVELINLPLKYPDGFARLQLEPPKGVLLHGPPGTGKTLLAQSAAAHCNAKFMAISTGELAGVYVGDTEVRRAVNVEMRVSHGRRPQANLRAVFQSAVVSAQQRACVLFIDEIDTLCPKRERGAMQENRVVAQLLTLMDGLTSRGQLVVVAATNRPNAIDPALRRPGRFDREVCILVPNPHQRLEILRHHVRHMPLAAGVDLGGVSAGLVGFVGADLAALARAAALTALRRLAHPPHLPPHLPHPPAPSAGVSGAPVISGITAADFRAAQMQIVASTRRSGAVTVAPTAWADIGGVQEVVCRRRPTISDSRAWRLHHALDILKVKDQLQQAVEWPHRYPDTFRRLSLAPPRGILLHGPPGCAKTTLVRAVASATNATFFAINGAQIYSPFVGESERFIRETFKQARLAAPAVLFLDEVDALVGKRSMGGAGGDGSSGVQERVLATLLNEMDGIEACAEILVVAATNRPDMLDRAFLRPGRIDKLIYVPLPDEAGRGAILAVHASKLPLAADVDLPALAACTPGFSGADLQNVCREAALGALRASLSAKLVHMRHFRAALRHTRTAAPEGVGADTGEHDTPSLRRE